jgi:Gpi18-like mannosyltransferase
MTLFEKLKDLSFSRLPEGLILGWCVSLLLFLAGLHSSGFTSDLNCWTNWFFEMERSGYKTINANYPPAVPSWIYVGSKTLGLSRETPRLQFLIKFWMQIPIWFAWMILLYQVAINLSRRGISPINSWVFWLTACNPAILLDGPMWGQVDPITWIPLSLSIYAFIHNRPVGGGMLFALSLCFKFQAISVSPIFAGLWLRAMIKSRGALWAIPASALVVIIAFLPFIIEGRGIQQAEMAYWGNISMYPSATVNAANLWRLWSHDSISSLAPMFTGYTFSPLTPQNIGLTLFALSSALIFITSFLGKTNSWAQMVTASFCFFAFCPEMHERYLFLAIPAAAVWAASHRDGAVWFVIATFAVSANIMFVYFPKSAHEWAFVSLLVCVTAIVLLFKSLGFSIKSLRSDFFDRLPLMTFIAFAAVPALWLSALIAKDNQRDLLTLLPGTSADITDVRASSIQQQFSSPIYKFKGISSSLRFNDAPISSGIKVHALSRLSYKIPDGKFNLSGRCGPEKVAHDKSLIRCMITLGNVALWESSPKKGRDPSEFFNIDFTGPGTLNLMIDPEGTNFGDHALWGDVGITKTE